MRRASLRAVALAAGSAAVFGWLTSPRAASLGTRLPRTPRMAQGDVAWITWQLSALQSHASAARARWLDIGDPDRRQTLADLGDDAITALVAGGDPLLLRVADAS